MRRDASVQTSAGEAIFFVALAALMLLVAHTPALITALAVGPIGKGVLMFSAYLVLSSVLFAVYNRTAGNVVPTWPIIIGSCGIRLLALAGTAALFGLDVGPATLLGLAVLFQVWANTALWTWRQLLT